MRKATQHNKNWGDMATTEDFSAVVPTATVKEFLTVHCQQHLKELGHGLPTLKQGEWNI